MYDQRGFQVPHPLGRCALGDRDPAPLHADGSLDRLSSTTTLGLSGSRTGCQPLSMPPMACSCAYMTEAEVLDGRLVTPPPVPRASTLLASPPVTK